MLWFQDICVGSHLWEVEKYLVLLCSSCFTFYRLTCFRHAVPCFTIMVYLYRVPHSKIITPCSVGSHSGAPCFAITPSKCSTGGFLSRNHFETNYSVLVVFNYNCFLRQFFPKSNIIQIFKETKSLNRCLLFSRSALNTY